MTSTCQVTTTFIVWHIPADTTTTMLTAAQVDEE